MGANTDRNFVQRLMWDEVARRIGDGAAAILPIGAAAKQHGFHLPINTDRIQAEWFAASLTERIEAMIWPTVIYGHYPAFVEYAGSSSLSAATFEVLVQEIAGGILAGGCRKLFVLNTGISTIAPVAQALARLDIDRVMQLQIYDGSHYRRAAEQLAEQKHGSHADETSLMLALAPHLVRMTRAEASPALKHQAPGRLTASDAKSPNYSRSGSFGDPTLATNAKGKILLAAILEDLYRQAASFIAREPHSDAIRSVPR